MKMQTVFFIHPSHLDRQRTPYLFDTGLIEQFISCLRHAITEDRFTRAQQIIELIIVIFKLCILWHQFFM